MTVPETILILMAGYYAAFIISWMSGPRRGARVGPEPFVILLGGIVTAMIFATGQSISSFVGSGAVVFFLVLVALPFAFILLGLFAGSAIGRLKRRVHWWKAAAAVAILAPALAMAWLTSTVQARHMSEAPSAMENAAVSQLGQAARVQATW